MVDCTREVVVDELTALLDIPTAGGDGDADS